MSITMIMVIIWIIAAVAFGIVEAFTQGLTSIWFAGGAVAAAITALFTQSILAQIIVFLIVTILLIAATRPLVKKHLNDKVQMTNSEALIGAEGIVLSEIVPPMAGQVKADGKVWTAVSEEMLEKDAIVVINEIKGVTLKVERKGE